MLSRLEELREFAAERAVLFQFGGRAMRAKGTVSTLLPVNQPGSTIFRACNCSRRTEQEFSQRQGAKTRGAVRLAQADVRFLETQVVLEPVRKPSS
jgi:hypothetical protein